MWGVPGAGWEALLILGGFGFWLCICILRYQCIQFIYTVVCLSLDFTNTCIHQRVEFLISWFVALDGPKSENRTWHKLLFILSQFTAEIKPFLIMKGPEQASPQRDPQSSTPSPLFRMLAVALALGLEAVRLCIVGSWDTSASGSGRPSGRGGLARQ